MPRLVRLPSIPSGWYYVVLHSVTNRRIVTSNAELKTILKVLRKTLHEKGARLHAGYIAEHEVHLVLQAGKGRLSGITGRFQHEYARVFNRTHGEHGSLFRLHHRALLFQQQKWLVPLTHFIHWIRRLDGWCLSRTSFTGFAASGHRTTIRAVFGGAAMPCTGEARNRTG